MLILIKSFFAVLFYGQSNKADEKTYPVLLPPATLVMSEKNMLALILARGAFASLASAPTFVTS